MRMSCNGCRVLRKGCTPNCAIKPCLQFLPSPQSQANATVFLAKFYGRAGLINLLSAADPDPGNLASPSIFKSLLYEACGRIVNPISGAVGLLSSGEWRRLDAAVESVLRGEALSSLRHVESVSLRQVAERVRKRAAPPGESESESGLSVEETAGSAGEREIGLELTLGLDRGPAKKRRCELGRDESCLKDDNDDNNNNIT